ncbi:MAG: hypothetical protein JWR44_1780 [Hymenobacter sp.]|nr:hypothetical protein [Hymenobacter sp.]
MSPTLLYYRNPLGSISYNSLGFVVLKWSAAPITTPELHSLYSHTIQALRHHHTCKLLTNQVERQPLPIEAQQWIVEQWIPQAIAECAYSHCAIVECEQEANRAATRAIGSRVAGSLQFRYFPTPDAAQEWLLTT